MTACRDDEASRGGAAAFAVLWSALSDLEAFGRMLEGSGDDAKFEDEEAWAQHCDRRLEVALREGLPLAITNYAHLVSTRLDGFKSILCEAALLTMQSLAGEDVAAAVDVLRGTVRDILRGGAATDLTCDELLARRVLVAWPMHLFAVVEAGWSIVGNERPMPPGDYSELPAQEAAPLIVREIGRACAFCQTSPLDDDENDAVAACARALSDLSESGSPTAWRILAPLMEVVGAELEGDPSISLGRMYVACLLQDLERLIRPM